MRRRRRRPPPRRAVANQRGGNPILVERMPSWQRGLFEAQLRVWQAGVAYEQAIGLNVAYGLPVPAELREAWERARGDWEPWLRMVKARRRRPVVHSIRVKGDLL